MKAVADRRQRVPARTGRTRRRQRADAAAQATCPSSTRHGWQPRGRALPGSGRRNGIIPPSRPPSSRSSMIRRWTRRSSHERTGPGRALLRRHHQEGGQISLRSASGRACTCRTATTVFELVLTDAAGQGGASDRAHYPLFRRSGQGRARAGAVAARGRRQEAASPGRPAPGQGRTPGPGRDRGRIYRGRAARGPAAYGRASAGAAHGACHGPHPVRSRTPTASR